jgi:ABC-type transport system substrate-binding protein
MCRDSSQPPASVLQRVLTRYRDQMGRVPGGGTHWVALDTNVKPLDNLNVRKAILAGFDREALRRTAGGEAIGKVAQSFIPPGLPGFERRGQGRRPVSDGKAIKPAGNSNWSRLNDPAINDAMAKASLVPAGKARDQAWADINHQITAGAPAIPWVWDDNFQLESKDVEDVMNRYTTTWDLSYSSLPSSSYKDSLASSRPARSQRWISR